jgi:hypothetical protein
MVTNDKKTVRKRRVLKGLLATDQQAREITEELREIFAA